MKFFFKFSYFYYLVFFFVCNVNSFSHTLAFRYSLKDVKQGWLRAVVEASPQFFFESDTGGLVHFIWMMFGKSFFERQLHKVDTYLSKNVVRVKKIGFRKIGGIADLVYSVAKCANYVKKISNGLVSKKQKPMLKKLLKNENNCLKIASFLYLFDLMKHIVIYNIFDRSIVFLYSFNFIVYPIVLSAGKFYLKQRFTLDELRHFQENNNEGFSDLFSNCMDSAFCFGVTMFNLFTIKKVVA